MKNEAWWMKHTIIRDEMNIVPEDNIPKLILEAERRVLEGKVVIEMETAKRMKRYLIDVGWERLSFPLTLRCHPLRLPSQYKGRVE